MNSPMVVPLCLFLLGCGHVYLPDDIDAAPTDPPAVTPDALPGLPMDGGGIIFADAAVPDAPGPEPLDAGPCVPVSYDFTGVGASGPSYALYLAEMTASDLLAWSASGFGATPGSTSLDPGETITLTWSTQDAADIELSWSEPGTLRLDFERWDGTRPAARIPAGNDISLVGPLRAVTLTALADATDLHLVSLGYCAR